VRAMPQGWAPPRMAAGNARVEPAPEWVDLVVPMARRPTYLVEEGDRSLVLTLYDIASNIDLIHYGAGGRDSLVQLVEWDQAATDRLRITLRLSSPPYGYLARWVRGAFVLRVRRPPHIDPSSPLAGLTIAVDPGHPPIGATGPTGLWEPVPTLAVGLKVKTLLEARGAHVVMTRTTPGPVALGDRPIIARKANANALVSIHLNALPDGINPFTNNGTGAYYFRAHSIPLARALQRGMVARMGLRDLGINYDNLRLARPTWMPAVLCEGAFLMMPEQEAALRTDHFQEAYANGVVDGLEAFFRGLVSTTAGSRPASAPPPSTAPATDSARRR
jgi:N-acetylmuramoyl-L-alanine amidase